MQYYNIRDRTYYSFQFRNIQPETDTFLAPAELCSECKGVGDFNGRCRVWECLGHWKEERGRLVQGLPEPLPRLEGDPDDDKEISSWFMAHSDGEGPKDPYERPGGG